MSRRIVPALVEVNCDRCQIQIGIFREDQSPDPTRRLEVLHAREHEALPHHGRNLDLCGGCMDSFIRWLTQEGA